MNNPESEPLTPAQEKAWEDITHLLGEHFDSFIVAFETEAQDNGSQSWSEMRFKGGKSVGIGLAERMKHNFLHSDDGMEYLPGLNNDPK